MELADIKKSIYDTISTTTYTCCEYTRVPDDVTFPYVTYNLIASTEGQKDSIENVDFTLEVDVLDYSEAKNTNIIETMISAINDRLNRRHVLEDNFTLSYYRSNFLAQLPTSNEYTFRRQLVFRLAYDERSD